MSRTLSVIVVLCVAAIPAAAHAADRQVANGAAHVRHLRIHGYAFSPMRVTVVVGTRVEWSNSDSDNHTVTADGGTFRSGTLGRGGSFVHVFAKPGTYRYHCSYHPFMRAVIVVKRR